MSRRRGERGIEKLPKKRNTFLYLFLSMKEPLGHHHVYRKNHAHVQKAKKE